MLSSWVCRRVERWGGCVICMDSGAIRGMCVCSKCHSWFVLLSVHLQILCYGMCLMVVCVGAYFFVVCMGVSGCW